MSCKSVRERVVSTRGTERKSTIVEGWIKVTYRIYWNNGESQYRAISIAEFVDYSDKDIVDYLVNEFQSEIRAGYIQKVKLISIGGEKVDVWIS